MDLHHVSDWSAAVNDIKGRDIMAFTIFSITCLALVASALGKCLLWVPVIKQQTIHLWFLALAGLSPGNSSVFQTHIYLLCSKLHAFNAFIFETQQQQHWYGNMVLLDLSSYTWQDEEPEAPAQIMASVILLWPQICLHTAGLMMGTPVKKSWHIAQ